MSDKQTSYDRDTLDAIAEAHFKYKMGADAVCAALNIATGKRYPERGSFTVICHKDEDRDKKKPGDYSIGHVITAG